MEEKVIEVIKHEEDKIQPKFNALKRNESNQSRIDAKDVPLSHLRSFAILRCGSISQFSKKLGVGRAMASKIMCGSYIPKKTTTIARISEVLGINSIILTKIFYNLQNEKDKYSK